MSMNELKARIAAELETPDNTPAPLTDATPAELVCPLSEGRLSHLWWSRVLK